MCMCMVEQNNTEKISGTVESTKLNIFKYVRNLFPAMPWLDVVEHVSRRGVSNDNWRMSDSILTLPCVEPKSLRTKVPAFKVLNFVTSFIPDIVSVL